MVYPNLYRGTAPTVLNRTWVADITYVGLAGGRMDVSGGDPGCVLAAGRQLGACRPAHLKTDSWRAGPCTGEAAARSRLHPSLRPRGTVCGAGIHRTASRGRVPYQHVASGQSIRHRARGELLQDAQGRGGLPAGVSLNRGGEDTDRNVHQRGIQRPTTALGAGIQKPRVVRTSTHSHAHS